jgi:hypothetical protein
VFSKAISSSKLTYCPVDQRISRGASDGSAQGLLFSSLPSSALCRSRGAVHGFHSVKNLQRHSPRQHLARGREQQNGFQYGVFNLQQPYTTEAGGLGRPRTASETSQCILTSSLSCLSSYHSSSPPSSLCPTGTTSSILTVTSWTPTTASYTSLRAITTSTAQRTTAASYGEHPISPPRSAASRPTLLRIS